MRGIKALLALSLTGLLAACGGGGSSTAEPDPAVAKVEIRETGALLTAAGANRQLSAVATDAQGHVVDVELTWSSSNAAAVAVDGKGQITAAAGTGSAQITAEAKGVRSTPLLVAVVTPPAGAMLLTDAQIVGDPVETDPNAAPSFANTYRVVLSGVVAPAIGQLLINTESKPVAGEVVAVDSTGGTHTVTLKLVSARVLFPGLNLNETFDLSRAPVEFATDVAARYDIIRSGNTFTFTPKPGAFGAATPRERALAATGTRALPPFTSCESSFSTLPIALSAPPLFAVTISPSLDVLYTATNGLERFVVQAEPVFKVEGGLNVTAAFEGKVDCKLELFVFRVPVGGPLSLVIGGLVPVGAGIEAGGKVTVASVGIGSKVEAKAKAQIGLACPGGSGCEFVRSLTDSTLQFAPTVDVPSIGDLRVEPTLMAYGYVKAEIGNPFLRRIRFEAFTAKAGGKLASSFAPMISQLTDTGYKSDYKVSLEASAGVGADLEGALSLLGLSSVTALELTISTDVAGSPTGTVTADRATFAAGDTVRFTVRFDPVRKDFFPGIGPYNISRVLLVRKNGLQTDIVATAPASAGQTEFTMPFAAHDFGSTSEFTAFVVTTLLPFDVLALEVGTARAREVLVIAAPGGSETCVKYEDEVNNRRCLWWSVVANRRAVLRDDTSGEGGGDPLAGLSVTLTGNACNVVSSSGQTDAQGLFTIALAPAGFAEGCRNDYLKGHLVLSWPGGGTAYELDFDLD